MRILVISGSRNPEGQTARAAKAFLDGATQAGASCEIVFLPELDIERCRQCDANGWGTCITDGRCVIDDDFAQLVDQMRAADAIAFANPVYFGDLSESLRAFLDRVRRTTRHSAGQAGIQGKPAVGMCVAGGSGGGAPACIASMEKALATTGFDVVDLIPARRQNLDMKCDVLRVVGKWLARASTPAP